MIEYVGRYPEDIMQFLEIQKLNNLTINKLNNYFVHQHPKARVCMNLCKVISDSMSYKILGTTCQTRS